MKKFFKKGEEMTIKKQNVVVLVGIVAMIGLIIGTFLEGGSLIQKILFLVGALTLTAVAYVNKQKMFLVIEFIVDLSAFLSFWNMALYIKYLILIGASIIGMAYLIKINFFKEDKWWPIGGLGLLFLAAGLATDAITYPLLFNIFLGFGGIFVAIYSAIGLFLFKVRIAAIWLILNIFFSINPMIMVCGKIFS